MYINPPEADLLHTLLIAMRWIACHGLFIAQVAVGDAFRLWIDAVNILNKQGLLSSLSLSLCLVLFLFVQFGRLRQNLRCAWGQRDIQ